MDQAKDAAGGMTDKMKAGVDKAADAADGATGGKFSEHIDKGADAAKSGIDKMGGNS
ncbi:MAG: antitoxin [Hamadaea sp.]|nr:antitoxin [Hamadaea sp.]